MPVDSHLLPFPDAVVCVCMCVVCCRDAAVSSTTSLRSGSPLPGVVEGSTTAGADSARGFKNITATPQSPKAPKTPTSHSRAASPTPSAAASLASHSSSNGFALSMEEEDGEGDAHTLTPGVSSGVKVAAQPMGANGKAPPAAGDKAQSEGKPGANGVSRSVESQSEGGLQEGGFPQGWQRQQPLQQQGSSNGAATADASNGNGNGNGKLAVDRSSQGGQNGAYTAHGSSNGNGAEAQQHHHQQQPDVQLVSAVNDIVPLGSKMSSDRAAAERVSSSSSSGSGSGTKVQQAAHRQ